MILQLEATSLFSDIAQMGMVFTVLVAIIVVLGRRVIKLEKKIDDLNNERFKEVAESTLLLKDATEAMKEVSKTRCKYDND